MRRSFLALALIGHAAIVTGCSPDYDLNEKPADESGGAIIEVAPSSLSYGMTEAGTESTQVFTITSVGDVAATIDEVRIDGSSAFSVVSFSKMRLQPGDSGDVAVTFTSTGSEETAQADVISDDPDVHSVDLIGGTPVPELTIDPADYDYGYVAAGTTADADFTLTNTGGATLTIDSISETDAVFSDSFAESLPFDLEPGDDTTVTVTFAPTDDSSSSGLLEVSSNDPAGVKSATLNGAGAADSPIAVCSVSPDTVEAVHESATWIGSASTDPSGYTPLTYSWTLTSKPTGSSATMPAGSGANRSGFTPDLAGTYEATLVVTNSMGERSDPCTATLEAIPSGDLWIEIYWTHSGDDMDLHLLKPSGSLTTNGDCYYANCTSSWGGLDWGVRGDATDDPILDLDDIPGTGPENINIDDPASGVYTVEVHDYPGSVYNGRNDVTMNIYIGGVLEWTDTRDINSEGTYFPFAEIDWPSGTVTAL
jgi:hypothetical protein